MPELSAPDLTPPNPQVQSPQPLLMVEDLWVGLPGPRGGVAPVAGVALSIHSGETLALLGESGCGKSMTALAITRLLPPGGSITRGQVRFEGASLPDLPESAMRSVRGGGIGMIFQEPATSLNPVLSIGAQMAEMLALHRGLAGTAAREEACQLLRAVGIAEPERRLEAYPFQLSGGMKQRVMIAMVLAGNPRLLIADEPTTALDVTIQAQVLDLLANIQAENGMGMLLITHDLGVVARMAHRVGVMYAAELIETGPRAAFFEAPLHPYSRALFGALPRRSGRGAPLAALSGTVPALDEPTQGCRFAARCPKVMDRCRAEPPGWHQVGQQSVRCHLFSTRIQGLPLTILRELAREGRGVETARPPLLEVRGLKLHFPVRKGLFKRVVGHVKAVDGVDLCIAPGQTVALVGESGCGKTSVGKAILQLEKPTGGQVFFEGQDLASLEAAELRPLRRGLQMIFQDPFASLNPRMRIGEILAEGMLALGVGENAAQRQASIAALLERVGLSASMAQRFPHEFSGGQRQRIAIARALAVSPRLIVCDEPTSALDVSVQAQILNLMGSLQRELGLAYLFITHNLAVVDYLAHEVIVMYLGRVVERGPTRKILTRPSHPYTRALLAAVPQLPGDEGADFAEGGRDVAQPIFEAPSPLAPPPGCHYHPRCPKATDVCRHQYPPSVKTGEGQWASCHWPSSS